MIRSEDRPLAGRRIFASRRRVVTGFIRVVESSPHDAEILDVMFPVDVFRRIEEENAVPVGYFLEPFGFRRFAVGEFEETVDIGRKVNPTLAASIPFRIEGQNDPFLFIDEETDRKAVPPGFQKKIRGVFTENRIPTEILFPDSGSENGGKREFSVFFFFAGKNRKIRFLSLFGRKDQIERRFVDADETGRIHP